MKKQLLKIAFLGLVISFTSCIDDDAPILINEEELITTVEYTLTNNADPSNTVVYKRVDPDGDGGSQPPVNTTVGTLRANATYSGSVRFLNETESPAEDITVEVMEESLEHEVFYTAPVAGVQIARLDLDIAGNPLGLRTTFTTGAAATGNLTIVLRHEPTKPNNGTITDAGGETDAQATFQISVQ